MSEGHAASFGRFGVPRDAPLHWSLRTYALPERLHPKDASYIKYGSVSDERFAFVKPF
jgi:hypothetical protein